ncbi:Mammalian cell entry related domain protein [Mycobacterium palustre]|uniref:Mammalian cell entry related domain protein n=1 Tax=Mycobacterium palustre TaxID=153971 RepID=A0A1X1ZM88_9MYCO|nr:Mammalian cell entry related domain protein [Mycobacterium palustre]ORW24443.1 Mammalian cell entry related domain protein [Mycobacterium palustre]
METSAESEARTVTIIGAALVLCCVAVAGFFVVNPFAGKTRTDQISLAIDTPYLVQGVVPGTALIMHGVQVGKVVSVSNLPGGAVRLGADLQKASVAGLTDSMQIDFRPANYFGVTGVNITPGTGGQLLRDGMQIEKAPTGNFTLQALLTRLGQLSTGVITPQLVSVIDRTTRYTAALDPLIETILIAANAVAKVQTVPTAQLLVNTTGLSVAFPGALNATSDVGDYLAHGNVNYLHKGLGDDSPEEFQAIISTIEAVANGLFGSIGRLEYSHVADLLPLVNGVQSITDAVPPLLRPDGVAQTLVELRTRFEKLYSGTPEQRALRVRIVLDSLPGIAAPLGFGGGQQ